jgi:spore germination protein YaaH
MMSRSRWPRALAVVAGLGVAALALLAAGCAVPSGETVDRVGLAADTPLPARVGSAVVDGCVLDTWQRATLAAPGARRVLREIILLCLVPRVDGTVGPRDPSAQAQLVQLAADLRNLGYRVHLGVSFTDETGQRYDGAQTRTFLADGAWRARFRETLLPALAPADGVELDLQGLPGDARDSVTALVTEVSQAVRPQKRLGVFVPPSVSVPSDLPGGEAFARVALGKVVDRLRVMTVDFSDTQPGPTIDPGWAVDAARVALAEAPAVDLAYPLYGTDFGPRGRRSTTWLEAVATASSAHAAIARGPTTALFVSYVSPVGAEPHTLWFDDATSTGHALGAWSYDVLPSDVGVVFYGLGAEEPGLFERLGARMP